MLRNKLRTAEILRQVMIGIRDHFESAVHNEQYRILPTHKVCFRSLAFCAFKNCESNSAVDHLWLSGDIMQFCANQKR
jgi:hypothetical protein